MATHDQTYLGPLFEALRDGGWIEFGEGENEYGIAAEFTRLAAEAGVIIHTDHLCDICQAEG